METATRKWSTAAKEKNRRRKAARRIYAKFPLLAVPLMRDLEEGGNGEFRYPTYSYTQLEEDLKRKTAPKIKKGKRPPLTFKQSLLDKWQKEINYQLKYSELDQSLVSKYYLLLNSPGRQVKFKVPFKGKAYVFTFPDNANEKTAKEMMNYINQQLNVCSSIEELKKIVEAYTKKQFFSYGN